MKTTKGISMYYSEEEIIAYMSDNNLSRRAAHIVLTNRGRYKKRKAETGKTVYVKKPMPVIGPEVELFIRTQSGQYKLFDTQDKVHIETYRNYIHTENEQNNTSRNIASNATDELQL